MIISTSMDEDIMNKYILSGFNEFFIGEVLSSLKKNPFFVNNSNYSQNKLILKVIFYKGKLRKQ